MSGNGVHDGRLVREEADVCDLPAERVRDATCGVAEDLAIGAERRLLRRSARARVRAQHGVAIELEAVRAAPREERAGDAAFPVDQRAVAVEGDDVVAAHGTIIGVIPLTNGIPDVLYRSNPDTPMVDAARTLRTAERYLLQPPLSARFGDAAVSICDVSAKGARFTHSHSLEMGHKSVLRLTLDGRPAPLQLEAVVVWTQVDPIVPSRFVTGVRTYGAPEVIDAMLEQLQKGKRTTRIEELRRSDRFAVQQPLEGRFDGARVTIEDLSVRGARIVTTASVAAGARGDALLHGRSKCPRRWRGPRSSRSIRRRTAPAWPSARRRS